jgi:type II secretory pathway component PulJ
MEVLQRAQTERNEALEQRMRHFETLGQRMRYFEAVLTSMGVSHMSPGAQQSLPPNGGSTSSVCNASVGMITIV